MTVLRSGSATDVGRVRTINQDIPLERPNLYAVADGMGGHAGGEVAARVAVETLEEAFERAPTSHGLRDAFSEANTAIWQESQANLDLRGMGTTLTAVALVGGPDGHDVLTLGNVGDSRAYLFTEGHIVQVTDDHSLAEERMRQGEMTEAEAAIHPQRHILTRALGVSTEVEADMWELHLRTGDRLLLCSDGLSNEVGTDEMAEILEAVDDPEEAAHRLVEVANEHGGSDNITVVIVDVQVGEQGNHKPSVVTPLAVRPGEATAAAAAAADSPAPEGDGPPGPGQATGPAADLAATALLASAVRDDETAIVPAREALAPGARLGFGDEQDQAGLAEEGPHSDEFFVGSIASVPLSRSTSRVPPAPATPAPSRSEEKESRGARRRRLGVPRRITPRVIGFVILVVAVPVAVYFAIKWYAYDNWYVTLQGDQIVVKQGQQGGVLWFKPKVVDHTGHTSSQVPSLAVGPLRAGVQEGSLTSAKSYVRRLLNEATTTTTTTTTLKTTTTTPSNHFVPAPPPTTAPPTTAAATTTTTAAAAAATAAVQPTTTQTVQSTTAVTAVPAATTGGTP
ncbi:MAG TPA: Stp1/IreP family PP2C-type Ser/Thr phosphatase [Acidimicrobiales bacterium]|nr:Stp1/IreP family PP2C-type Ser/Thr phosphatase [Acidimicrobiales bacterium]